ncbi:MAG: class I SAM-dependent methyltransferase [bacterium]
MRETFIDKKTGDYKISKRYKIHTFDPNIKGFREHLPFRIKNKIALVESEELEFIEFAHNQTIRGDLVLDVGCGQGRYKKAFSHTNYIGVDFGKGGTNWDYSKVNVICDVLNLPFKKDSFNVVLNSMVLEHVNDPQQCLIECADVLKKEGKLFLVTPQGYGEHQSPHDYFRFSYWGLEYLLKKAGLKINFIKPMGGIFYVIGMHLKIVPEVIASNIKIRIFKNIVYKCLVLLFYYLVPFLLFYLDRMDKGKGITLYYGCYAKKE